MVMKDNTENRRTKRSAQGGGTMRKRADGIWEGRYTVGRDPGTGKQIQKSVYAKTQKEVRKKLQQATTAIDDGMYIEPSKMTVKQWLEIWYREYTGQLKPRTRTEYKAQIDNHISTALGAVKLQALNAHMIQSFYNKLHRGMKDKKGLSPKTVKNVHGILHRALEQAVEIGYIKYNAANACKLPRITKAEIQPLDDTGIAEFLNAIKGHKYERVYLVGLFTGLRQSEILGLTWDCIDFKKGTIYVYRQLQKVEDQYLFGTLKNNKARKLSPAPEVMKILRKQNIDQKKWKLKAGIAWEPWQNEKLVFTNELGGHLCHKTIYNNFKDIMRSLKRPDTRFHDLRHTYAVAAIRSGDDIKTVQENLGHHAAAFTLDTYGHVTETMKKESSQRMQSYINSVKGKLKGKR